MLESYKSLVHIFAMRAPGATNQQDFVQEVIDGLRKRSKAIKHSGGSLDWERVKEIENGVESTIGRLDVDVSYRISASAVRIRLIVWSDRWIWIDVRRRAKLGWAWEVTAEGRFLSEQGARDLIRRLEETIDVTWSADAQIASLVERIWKPHLAHGPKRL